MNSQQKTTVAVVGLVGFSLLGCCGLTVMLGSFVAWQEQRELAAQGPVGGPVALVRAFDDAGAPVAGDDAEVFAEALIDELADAGHPGYAYVADDDSLQSDAGVLSLGNLRGEWSALPDEARPDFVRRAARGVFPPEVPETWEAARPNVLVTVRDRLFVELMTLRQGTPPLHRPAGEALVEVLVYDAPDSMQYLTAEQAARWGVDAKRLFTAGRSELLARSRGAGFTEVSPGLFESPWQDNHDVGRALLPALLKGLAIRGEPVLFLPHRDHLLVAGAEDPEALLEAAARVEGLLAGPRPMSGRAWRVTKQELEPFSPPSGSPAAERLRALERESALRDLNEQKEALDAKHAADGVDLFVGSALLLDDDAGGEHSYCVWTKGVDSLLPRTEYVVFVDVEGEEETGRIVAAAPWAEVEARLGTALARDDATWPPRYRARRFPQPAALEALGLHPLFAPRAE